MSNICNTVISGSKNAVNYGYQSEKITLAGASGTWEIWDSLNLPGISGTVLIIGDELPAAASVLINGINTTAITNNIFSRSIDPLSSVSIYATTSATTSVIASVIATGYQY